MLLVLLLFFLFIELDWFVLMIDAHIEQHVKNKTAEFITDFDIIYNDLILRL